MRMTSFYNDKRLNLGVFLQQTRILVRYYRESKFSVILAIFSDAFRNYLIYSKVRKLTDA